LNFRFGFEYFATPFFNCFFRKCCVRLVSRVVRDTCFQMRFRFCSRSWVPSSCYGPCFQTGVHRLLVARALRACEHIALFAFTYLCFLGVSGSGVTTACLQRLVGCVNSTVSPSGSATAFVFRCGVVCVCAAVGPTAFCKQASLFYHASTMIFLLSTKDQQAGNAMSCSATSTSYPHTNQQNRQDYKNIKTELGS
jgi:hypothetical protein